MGLVASENPQRNCEAGRTAENTGVYLTTSVGLGFVRSKIALDAIGQIQAPSARQRMDAPCPDNRTA